MVATARLATSRSDLAASTIAPPGICPIRPTRPPIDSTNPISTWVHFCVVRYTAMNGPNPVCTSARKKMNQSRPRWLCREGAGAAAVAAVAAGSGTGATTAALPAGRAGRPPASGLEWVGGATRVLLLMIDLQRLEAAGRAEH